MRFVDRTGIPPPASLTAPDGQGAKELAQAKTYYRTRRKKAYEFQAYKAQDVVSTLETLFCKKCAYCEHRYAAGSPMDVEHFRPKAAIKSEKRHRGYWWLACEWTNLLPSCIDCNRSRYHDRVEGLPEFDDGTDPPEVLYGKGNEFPIGGKRARKPDDDHDKEEPLLIDPTRCDPSAHITWETIHGGLHIAKAVWNDADRAADKFGTTSIRIFGLNRRALMEDRAQVVLTIEKYKKTLKSRIQRAASSSGEGLDEILDEIFDDLCTLREYGKPGRPYSAAAGHAINEFIADIRANLEEALRKLGDQAPPED